ncbi:MAG: M15 family metallopeptidase [Thermoanaerobaculia bacterium]
MLTEHAPSAPPHGLAAIVSAFGDPRPLIGKDGGIAPTWEVQHITRVRLPRPLRYAHCEVTRVAVNRHLARHVRELFEDLEDHCLWDELAGFRAGYVVRPMSSGDALSTHAWGIALDLIPRATMPEQVVRTFAHYGFSWGGPREPEHFQWATGYGLREGSVEVASVAWVPLPLPYEAAFVAV